MYCSNCGSKNKEDAQYCSNCGEPLNKMKDDREHIFERNTGKKSNKMILVFSGLILLLILGIVIGMLFWKKKGVEEERTFRQKSITEEKAEEKSKTVSETENTTEETGVITAEVTESQKAEVENKIRMYYDSDYVHLSMIRYVETTENGNPVYYINGMVESGLKFYYFYTETEFNQEDGSLVQVDVLSEYELDGCYFMEASASSVCPSERGFTYDADHVIDGDDTTAWIEGKEGMGIGEWVQLQAEEPTYVSGIAIKNGYIKSDKTLTRNAQVKTIRIYAMGMEPVTYELSPSYDTEGNYSDVIWFEEPVETDYLKFEILDTFEGEDYVNEDNSISEACDDTCISEIKVIE